MQTGRIEHQIPGVHSSGGEAHLTSSWGALFETSRTKSFAFSSPPRGEWNAMCSSSSSTERHWKDLQCLHERMGRYNGRPSEGWDGPMAVTLHNQTVTKILPSIWHLRRCA